MKTHTYTKKQHAEEKLSTATTDIASSSNNYGMPPPTNLNTASRLAQIDEMKLFFATATQQWESNKNLKRFSLPSGTNSSSSSESVSCVLWNDLFFITGTDIVRSLNFRFHAFGRPVTNAKKFEEGIFSDLRNLKPGHDARLEEPKSELLDMLYKNNCIRTQKKQKVFFWFSVPHDRLFLDALERDLKREKMGMEPTTTAVAEPATSLSLDSTQELFDQLRKSMSQSAAATQQAIEQASASPMPSTSLSLNHVTGFSSSTTPSSTTSPATPVNGSWSPPKAATHTPWSASQSRLERAASQASKRSRVNSVPANIGQQQHFQLMQQQKHHRMSHGSYFSSSSTSYKAPRSSTSSRQHHRTSSSASSLLSVKNEDGFENDACSVSTSYTAKSPTTGSNKFDQQYLDPISHGVDQLEITTSLSSHSTSSSVVTLPSSKSMDSNAMKKTKTIFGNLSLFDGSPTYKQRRRRAASVSNSSGASNGAPSATAARSGRHKDCHLRHAPSHSSSHSSHSHHHHSAHAHSHATNTAAASMVTPPNSNNSSTSGLINSNSSRLAMAAVKAGFAPNQIISQPPQPTTMQMLQMSSSSASNNSYSHHSHHQQPPVIEYLCPITHCGRLFKRSEHLERHINTPHLVCNYCGKNFVQQEILDQHYRLEHEFHGVDHHPMSVLHDSDHNNHDDDYRGGGGGNIYQQQQQQRSVFGGNTVGDSGFYSSTSQQQPRHHSFDASRSSGWSTTANNITSTTARSVAGGGGASTVSNDSSRCSTLSPMLDLDFDMPDIPPPAISTSNKSSSQSSSGGASIILPTTATIATEYQQMNPIYSSTSSLWHPTITPSFMNEDEYTTTSSTSSASSPCSALQLQYGNSSSVASNHSTHHPYHQHENMTLLSPFKPMNPFHQQQQQEFFQQRRQQMMQPMEEQQYSSPTSFVEDVSMFSAASNHSTANDSMYATVYADHQHQQQQHYTPSFITSPDNMNIVFGA